MIMRRSVSIEDIARAAGVSHTTVSRALRNNPVISAPVRAQIQQLAEEMGYIPNAIAQSLKDQRSNTIGLVVTSIADPFVGRVVRGIEEVAQRANLGLILSVTNNNPDQEMAVIEGFHRRRVDGIIIVSSKINSQYHKRLEQIKAPKIIINPQSDTAEEMLHSVSIDDYGGAYKAIEYLVSVGHRSIGYLGEASRPHSNRRRLEGYRDALKAAGIECRESWVVIAPPENDYYRDDVEDGKKNLPKMLQAGVSAVFCYNDMVAIGALTACRSLGIAVPSQLSIVGFDDIEMSEYMNPPLTTVHQPKLRLGQVSMEMVLGLIAGNPVVNAVLPTNLVLRGTTTKPAPQS